MFSRSQRISSSLLDEILAKGRSFRSQHFSVVTVRDVSVFADSHAPISHKPRIAVLVPKKIASKAVKRNQLRRQARAWIKAHLAKYKMMNDVGAVILVNSRWEGPFPVQLKAELQQLLFKTGVMV